VPYYLVLLRGSKKLDEESMHTDAHERFITSLIRENKILLGGGLASPPKDVYAVYVLHCDEIDSARHIASEDPFVVNEVLSAECVEWKLVGINPDAIDPAEILRPDDV
jgi:uncharacterized protein YciI